MNFVRHKQIITQLNVHATCQQLNVKVSHPTNGRANSQTPFEHPKCIIPRTFSQKLYQIYDLEIAEEFEQALERQSLARINELLTKLLEKNTDR